MIEVLSHTDNTIFSFCLALMFILSFFEIILFIMGFGISSVFDSMFPDLDLIETPALGKLGVCLSWLCFGQIPPYFFLLLFLAVFGTVGTLLQYGFFSVVGSPIAFWIALPISFVASIPFVRLGVSLIKKLMPKEDTTVLNEEDFIGKIVNITLGQATYETPAQAKYIDKYGQSHYLMVASASKQKKFNSTQDLIVVKKEKHLFRVKLF